MQNYTKNFWTTLLPLNGADIHTSYEDKPNKKRGVNIYSWLSLFIVKWKIINIIMKKILLSFLFFWLQDIFCLQV